MSTYVSVTVSFLTQHLTDDALRFRTLCGFTGAHDQRYIDRAYGGCYQIVDMPRCKSCDKIAKARA